MIMGTFLWKNMSRDLCCCHTTPTYAPSCCHDCHIQTLLLPHLLPHTTPLAATPLPHSNPLAAALLPHSNPLAATLPATYKPSCCHTTATFKPLAATLAATYTHKQTGKQTKQANKQTIKTNTTQQNKTNKQNTKQKTKQNKTKTKTKQTNKQTNKWNKQVKQTNKCLLIEIHFQYFPIIYVITLRFTDPSCLHFLARNGKAKAQRATCWASFGVPVWDLGAFHRRMAVGARQCGSRGVAVWQSGHGSVAVGAWRRGAAPLPHATATLKAPQCHTDTPKLAQHVASCALALPFVAKTCKQEGLVNRSVIT